MLREGDDDPQRRLEVVHVDVEGGVLGLAEDELVLAEAVLDGRRAVLVREQHVLLGIFARVVAVGEVQL